MNKEHKGKKSKQVCNLKIALIQFQNICKDNITLCGKDRLLFEEYAFLSRNRISQKICLFFIFLSFEKAILVEKDYLVSVEDKT